MMSDRAEQISVANAIRQVTADLNRLIEEAGNLDVEVEFRDSPRRNIGQLFSRPTLTVICRVTV